MGSSSSVDARSHELEAEGSKKGVPERLEKRPSEEDHCSKERQLKLREEEVARRERELKRMKMEMTNLQIEVDKVKRRLCSLEREEEDREESWRSAIDEEINVSVKRAPTITANTLGSPISSPPMGDDHSDDDDDEDDNIYDDPEGGDVEEEDPYSQADDITTIYDKPDTDDDPYDEIDDGRILPPSNPLVKPQPHTSPSHGPGGPLAVRTFRGIDHWEVAPTHRVVAGKDGAPTVPMRSAISLGLDHGTSKPPGTGPTSSRAETGTAGARANHQAATEPSYLSLLRENSASGVAEPLDRTRLHSPPAEGRSSISEGSQLPKTIMRDGRAIVLPTVAEREDTDRDYEDDFVESNSNGEGPYDGDSDAYYIMFRKPEELMPPCCVFDTLDRDEANRLLRSNGRDGTYLIRSGRHSGTEKVLSVWHDDKCRHYKLFKSEAGRYSLTQGETFQTIPELLQYYALQSQLPKSDFYLSDAYHPTDH